MGANTNDHPTGIRWPIVGAGAGVAAVLVVATIAVGPGPDRDADPRVPDSDPNAMADSLIARWIEAAGGMDMYAAFQSAEFTVSTITYDTLSGRVKRDRPRYALIKKGPQGEETRVERWETEGFIEQGFNGVVSWAMLDGEMLPDSAKDAREALYVSRDLFYWMGLPFKLRDEGVNLTYRGMVSRPGAQIRDDPAAPMTMPPENAYHAVGVGFDVGVGEHQDVFTYYFERGNPFPVEVTYVEEGRTSLNRLVWGPTAQTDGPLGYPYVTRRDYMTESGKRTKSLIIYDVSVNVEIPQQRFDHPQTS